ncbi:uncharacterized protein [Asterias amurensis]|uniref:uncharacterized protein isoform X2 n=1 Tax=Asterias amurensis TaxID=7602 RepID=UPI003AB11A65
MTACIILAIVTMVCLVILPASTITAVTCPVLPSLRNGEIVPASCGERRQRVRRACAFSCDHGFRLQGPLTKLCQTTGNWSPYELVACVDDIPPEITCPESIVENAEPGLSSAEVTWDMPVYSDNVDGTDALTVTVHPAGLKPSHRFEIGSVRVRYTVTDTAGLSAECYFKVVVLDTQPPTVENCPDEIHETSSDKISTVTWDEPQFADNSKGDLNLTQSHQPGVELAWGVHIVTYTATDAAGLESECQFRIRISLSACPYYPDPRNGAMACDQWLFGSFCRVYCNQGYEFAEKPAVWYMCGGGRWTTSPFGLPIPWPDCSEKHDPTGVRLGIETQYYAGDCTNAITKRAIQAAFVDDFKKSMFGGAGGCMGENYCLMEEVTVYCGEINEDSFTEGSTSCREENGERNCTCRTGYRKSGDRCVDTQPPTVENCPDEIHKTSSDQFSAVTWDEPQFADNSKGDLNLTQSHQPGVELAWGVHIVTYTATDAAGLESECQFRIRISPSTCPNYPDPRNGARACDQWLFGSFCRVYCNQGYEFAEKPAVWYMCGRGRWTTTPFGLPIPWPDCSEKHDPSGARQGMETQYYAGDCTNAKTQRAIQAAFVDDFRKSMFGRVGGGCTGENSCLMEEVTVYCGEINEDSFTVGSTSCREENGERNCTCRTGYRKSGDRCVVFTTCERYLLPSDGYQLSCNTTDNRIDTVCNLTCSEGYDLEGRLQIWCHLNEDRQLGEWSTTGGGRCNAKTCPILVAETHTRIAPPDCMERQLDYKSQCFYECDCGFHLRGVSSRTCQADGTWSDPSVQNTCIDIEPPEFITCPGDISLPTDLNENFATNPANWDQPEARDNDGEPVIEASLSATQQRFYLDEVTVITYTARDETGLENTCTFSVTVKDEEPPQVINCPNSMAVKTDNRLAVVHWEEPVFQDNSRHDASVISNRPSGSTFFFGQPKSIWYIAEDQAGNTARCEFTVSEEDLEPPEFITCPEDIVLSTNLHENFTTTTWDRPEARDNFGTPTIEASPSAAKERFYLDEVTVVTYTARDRSGLQSTCTFSITVTDEEPPQVVSCPGSMAIKTKGSSEIVHWEEPVFQDNSGKEVTVINSDLSSGFTFSCGLMETVYYIAEDQAGNKAICEFTVDVMCMN